MTIVFALAFAGATAAAVMLYLKLAEVNTNPQQVAQEQVDSIIQAVSKLVVLPQDETPTVATVTDLSQLQGQPFFADAKVGDKVIMYPQAEKAILYDPTSNKVVEIAPFNVGAEEASASATSSLPARQTKK